MISDKPLTAIEFEEYMDARFHNNKDRYNGLTWELYYQEAESSVNVSLINPGIELAALVEIQSDDSFAQVDRITPAILERILYAFTSCDVPIGRAEKLLYKGKPFIVIAVDEPYFAKAYEMIKREELEQNRWTEECQSQRDDLVAQNTRILLDRDEG